jgi:ubiquitin-conjugating enzyme E2 Q
MELTNFDKDLPLAKDMKFRQVNSLLMEIRFTENFPSSHPFIHPKFLPFAQRGGGHVTKSSYTVSTKPS